MKAESVQGLPPELSAIPGLQELWHQRIEALKPSRRPTLQGQALQLKELTTVLRKRGPRAVIAAVEEAINRGWTGLRAEWVEHAKDAGLGPSFGERKGDGPMLATPCAEPPAGLTCVCGRHERPWTEEELAAAVDRAQARWSYFGGRDAMLAEWRSLGLTHTVEPCRRS